MHAEKMFAFIGKYTDGHNLSTLVRPMHYTNKTVEDKEYINNYSVIVEVPIFNKIFLLEER